MYFCDKERSLLQKIVFGLIVFILGFRWYSEVMIHQLNAPVLLFPYVDLGYWVALWTGIPQFLTQNFYAGLIFDLSITTIAIISIFFTKKRIFPILFSLLFAIYFFTYNSYGAHHTHSIVGVLMVTIPFWAMDIKRFSRLWEGLRYFTLFIYVNAFLWKFLRGSWWSPDQGLSVVMDTQVANIFYQPDSFYSQMVRYFITHSELLEWLYFIAILLEGVMIIGFFTKKYDWLCFLLPFCFHLGTYLFVDVLFYELLILQVVFLPWFWQRK